jgi:transglutaminase-like putative cysteine protease
LLLTGDIEAAQDVHPRRLNHVTHYRYDRPVTLGPQVVRLRPAPHCRSIISYSLRSSRPALHQLAAGPVSPTTRRGWCFPKRPPSSRSTVDLVAEMAVYNPFDFFLEPEAENFPFAYAPELAHELAPYLVTRAADAAGSRPTWTTA